MDISKIGVGGQTYDIKDAIARETAEGAKGLELIGSFFKPFAYVDYMTDYQSCTVVDSELTELLQSGQVRVIIVRCAECEYTSVTWENNDNNSFHASGAGDIDMWFTCGRDVYVAEWLGNFVEYGVDFTLELYR